MQMGHYKFNKTEFSGSLGDIGTIIPLAVALILITGMKTSPVLLMIGAYYIISGLYFKLPLPVQPMKVIAAIAIAFPDKISVSCIGASGVLLGLFLLLIAYSGFINRLAVFFTKPIVRGIQVGLGFILLNKGINLIQSSDLFIHQPAADAGYSLGYLNTMIGIAGFVIVLLLLSNRRFPAALVLLSLGIITGIFCGAMNNIDFSLGPTPIIISGFKGTDFLNGLIFLVIPQIPLTLGNAIMGTADACQTFFGKNDQTEKVSYKSLSASMGIANIISGFLGGIPMCHGAGGLAAHYRFGARTGGSNIMIGAIFLVIGLFFGRAGITILSAIPNSILGVLLVFTGIELAIMIKDLSSRNDLFIAILIAGTGFATTNMGIAFMIGIFVVQLQKHIDITL